jgi:predicted lipid carrier protein YhbT
MTPMTPGTGSSRAALLLRLIPPPAFVAPLVRAIPAAWLRPLVAAALRRGLAEVAGTSALGELHGRRLGVDVTDLGLQWVVEVRGDGVELAVQGSLAEATVRGTATDLLLLASRLEDADTLFFQRRLQLTGDTELGLTVRNLLDQLPWDSVPLYARIALDRGARLARDARAARRNQETRDSPSTPCQ